MCDILLWTMYLCRYDLLLTLLTLGTMRRQGKANVVDIIKRLREGRGGLVQHAEQAKFVHLVCGLPILHSWPCWPNIAFYVSQ